MSDTVTANCADCGAKYLVNYETVGEAVPARHSVHCFQCETCGVQLSPKIPANANLESIKVSRDR